MPYKRQSVITRYEARKPSWASILATGSTNLGATSISCRMKIVRPGGPLTTRGGSRKREQPQACDKHAHVAELRPSVTQKARVGGQARQPIPGLAVVRPQADHVGRALVAGGQDAPRLPPVSVQIGMGGGKEAEPLV